MKSPREVRRENHTVTCKRCRKNISGWVAFDEEDSVVDSGAFTVVEFGADDFNPDACVCDSCMVEVTGEDGTRLIQPNHPEHLEADLERTAEWISRLREFDR